MRKILIVFLTMIFLVGCRKADSQEIVLSDEVSDQEITVKSISDSSNESESLLTDMSLTEKDKAETDEAKTCAVFVCGAVVSPGVYYLGSNSRIVDAVDAAGGFAEDADKDYVNLAYPIQDGLKLQIPTVKEVAETAPDVIPSVPDYDISIETGAPNNSGNGSGLININTATSEELMTIPGIGKGIAGKIIDYREENGKFSTIEDIMKVSGIKDKLFSKIKEHITV